MRCQHAPALNHVAALPMREMSGPCMYDCPAVSHHRFTWEVSEKRKSQKANASLYHRRSVVVPHRGPSRPTSQPPASRRWEQPAQEANQNTARRQASRAKNVGADSLRVCPAFLSLRNPRRLSGCTAIRTGWSVYRSSPPQQSHGAWLGAQQTRYARISGPRRLPLLYRAWRQREACHAYWTG